MHKNFCFWQFMIHRYIQLEKFLFVYILSPKVYPTHSQLLEVTSKAVDPDEEVNDNVTTLTHKLSAAHLNISTMEELVKQHAKVAEEAVSGITFLPSVLNFNWKLHE